MKAFLRRNTAWLSLFLITLVFVFLTDGAFLFPRNLTNLIRQATVNGVLACGMTLVILTGGIDLSVGSAVALAGMAIGLSQANLDFATQGMLGFAKSAGIALGIGGLAGTLNGGLIVLLRIPPFVITLGMMVLMRGLALLVSGGNGISPMGAELQGLGEESLGTIGTVAGIAALGLPLAFQWRKLRGDLMFPAVTLAGFATAFLSYRGLPLLSIFLIAGVLATATLLSRTTLGRAIFALGSNETAAYWAGVPIGRVKIWTYGLNGLFAGIAALLLTARLNSAVPTAGSLFELDAIAAVVIGGTSLKGGTGSVQGSLVGALTIAALNNGLDLVGVSSFYQMVLKGIIIILAVALDRGEK